MTLSVIARFEPVNSTSSAYEMAAFEHVIWIYDDENGVRSNYSKSPGFVRGRLTVKRNGKVISLEDFDAELDKLGLTRADIERELRES
jgi:hypothetical protein